MQNDFSLQELKAEEWVKKAGDDERSAHSILTHRDGAPSGVCFLSHQFAEKYLKAFLVSRKNWFPKIHPLDKLVELCGEIDPSFKSLRDDSIFLQGYYTPSRYPGDYPEFTWQDSERAFESASRIKTFVLDKIKN
jgi:HEPN domain-containing protein